MQRILAADLAAEEKAGMTIKMLKLLNGFVKN